MTDSGPYRVPGIGHSFFYWPFGQPFNNRVMSKSLLSILMAAVAVISQIVSCNGGADPGCEENIEQELPPETIVDETTSPEISLSDDYVLLYPASTSIPAMLPFSVRDLDEDGEVTVSAPECLSVSLSFERTQGKGTIIIQALEEFSLYSSFTVRAANGESVAEVEVEVDEVYVMPQMLNFAFGAEGGARKVLVDANVPWKAGSSYGWLTVDEVSDEGIVFSLRENTSDYARYGEVIVSDVEGHIPIGIYVEQLAPEREQEIVGERAALEKIYRSLHGEDWSDSENWCTDAPLKQWYGVMTNTFKGEEHVVYLHLQCLGAHGTIPSEIGELKYLRELWIIGDEGITGNIPSSIGNLKELRDLSISGTSISGPIPQCLASLQKLEIFGLDGNCLTGNLPLFLRDLQALYNFGFSQNCLDGEIDASLTETIWWNTIDTSTGRTLGEENLLKGQKEGHALWL